MTENEERVENDLVNEEKENEIINDDSRWKYYVRRNPDSFEVKEHVKLPITRYAESCS